MPPRIICFGAGGHASVLVDALRSKGNDVIGYLDSSPSKLGSSLLGRPVIGPTELLEDPASIHADAFVLGVSSTGHAGHRESLFERCVSAGLDPFTVIHASATVSDTADLGLGTAVLAGSVVQPNTRIGTNVILNTGTIVSHDASVEAHSHIAPGAILLGETNVGTRTHIGAGASIRQCVVVGSDAVVGMGAVVTRDVPDGAVVMGVPAAPVEPSSR
mgnify:CR=1 FL=1